MKAIINEWFNAMLVAGFGTACIVMPFCIYFWG